MMAEIDKITRKQANIAIFSLLIGLGFFKLNELSTFLSTIEKIVLEPTLMSVIFMGGAFITYFIYVLSIGVGLFLAFKDKKGVDKAMIVALGAFFVFYIVMLAYNFSNTNLAFSK